MRFLALRTLLILNLAVLGPFGAALASDDDDGPRRTLRLQPLTGSFQIYGQPRWDLGGPYGSPGGPTGEHVAEV